jgi:hypothetical protein
LEELLHGMERSLFLKYEIGLRSLFYDTLKLIT